VRAGEPVLVEARRQRPCRASCGRSPGSCSGRASARPRGS
jgi:hypothetical protein